jgi:PiT family inorganic phosphate transporter
VTAFLLVAVLGVGLAFSFTNGFHDSANAIAISVSTRALAPRVALTMAAVMNVLGALISTRIAATIGHGIVAAPPGDDGLVLVLAAVLGAIAWNLITWRAGLPSSSSHALIGGLVGAALASAGAVHWHGILDQVVVPMVVSPVVAIAVTYPFMLALLWAFRNHPFHRVTRRFRYAQIGSAAVMAFGHGTQDAPKTMGVLALALVVSGHLDADAGVPLWVVLAAAAAIALGTYTGGQRIMRTVGGRIYHLTPVSGFAAETSATAIMLVASRSGWPISTTHVISSSIMGAGATRRLSAVRWGVAADIVTAWVITMPAAAVGAAVLWFPLHLIFA